MRRRVQMSQAYIQGRTLLDIHVSCKDITLKVTREVKCLYIKSTHNSLIYAFKLKIYLQSTHPVQKQEPIHILASTSLLKSYVIGP